MAATTEDPWKRPRSFTKRALSDPGSSGTRQALASLIEAEVAEIEQKGQESGVSFLLALRHQIAEAPGAALPFFRIVSEQCLVERRARHSSLEAIIEVLPAPDPVIQGAVRGESVPWTPEAVEAAIHHGVFPAGLPDVVLSRKTVPERLLPTLQRLLAISSPEVREALVIEFARSWRRVGMKPVEIEDIVDLPGPLQWRIFEENIFPDGFFGRRLRALRLRWSRSALRAPDIALLVSLPSFRSHIRRMAYIFSTGPTLSDEDRILERALLRLDPKETLKALSSRKWGTQNPASVLEPRRLAAMVSGRQRVRVLRDLLSCAPLKSWLGNVGLDGNAASEDQLRFFESCVRAFRKIERRPSKLRDYPLIHLAFNASRAPNDEREGRRSVERLPLASLRSVLAVLGRGIVQRARREAWPDAELLEWLHRHPARVRGGEPGSVAREICRAFDMDAVGLLTVLAAEAWKNKQLPAGTVFDSRYRTYTLPKKAGGTRTITEPEPHLKWLQRQLLDRAFGLLPLPDCVHGFRPGHSILTNARPHTGKPLVVNIDIDEFFPSVKYPLIVRACGRLKGGRLSANAVMLLADLCSYQGALPTGAPTSPAIGNAVLAPLDAALIAVCSRKGIAYTRYADDLTFSGGNEVRDVLPFVKDLLAQLGLAMDAKKLNFFRRGRRQIVTGLVVNETPNLPRRLRRRLRAAVHRRLQNEPIHWHGKPMDAAQLAGRIAFLGLVRPEEARKLRSRLPVPAPPDGPGDGSAGSGG